MGVTEVLSRKICKRIQRMLKGRVELMKDGLQVGDTATLTVEVTREMFAQFGGELVHPAYSTTSMVYHMEWAARKLIIPYLEEHEEGMGAAVSVQHLAPSGLGTVIQVTAIVTQISKRGVTADVTVKNQHGFIGKGEVQQAILPKAVINEKLSAAT